MQDAYNQLQFMELELYYLFLDLDSDRYVVDGRLRQVLVGARELDPGNLPADAQNWVNQRLQYTHGYGISMSPATGFSPGEGRPEYFLQDIPIRGEFPVSRPELYYSETSVNLKTRQGYVQGYNAQAVVSEGQIIVAVGVTQEANDVQQLAIVNTAMPEVDPQPAFQHYGGSGGVPLSSTLRRLAKPLGAGPTLGSWPI